MRRKLEISWTARLPVVRWWHRRHSPFASYVENHDLSLEEQEVFSRLTVVCRKR